ncbi:MAG: phage tail protein [Anaerolineales bacterium]|nr:phage tail protein [Anaerolineales bacterium]
MPMLDPTENTGADIDLLSVHYFLDVGNVRLATFYRLEGGGMEVGIAKHDVVFESGESTTFMIPTTTAFKPITLARGINHSSELYNWFTQASLGHIFKARRNCSIIANGYYNDIWQPLVIWNLTNAWIQSISGFECNQYTWANLAELTITLVVEAIQREDLQPI